MPAMPDIPKVEAAVVEQTNAFRAASKLPAVRIDATLSKAARGFAEFLAASTLFSHEADGRRPIDRIKAAGYGACSSAENLAWHSDGRGFETLQLAGLFVEGWKTSPGHRKNLLMEYATETGVAVVKARREEKYYAVQLFARPETMRFSFRVENATARDVPYVIAGETITIKPRQIVTHTTCVPLDLSVEIKPGGLISKPELKTFRPAKDEVYRLTGAGSAIAVEVGTK